MVDLSDEIPLGALLRDLAQFTLKIREQLPHGEIRTQPPAEATLPNGEIRAQPAEAALPNREMRAPPVEAPPALPEVAPASRRQSAFRLEQWDDHGLRRVVIATAHLEVALEGWTEAVRLNPRGTWVVRHGENVVKQHQPI
jgi:hypothetical protein